MNPTSNATTLSDELDIMDDALDNALALIDENDLIGNGGNALMSRNGEEISSATLVQVNQSHTEETANFNLEIPGFNWQALPEAAKPNINISGGNVLINFGK